MENLYPYPRTDPWEWVHTTPSRIFQSKTYVSLPESHGPFCLCSPLCVRAMLLQSCPALWDPVHCSPPGSSVHGILRARILEWVSISYSRRSSWPRDWICISYISFTGSRFFSAGAAKPICSPSVALKTILYLQVTSLLLKGKLFKSWSYDSRGRSQWKVWNLRCWRRRRSLGMDPSGTGKDGAEGQAGMFSVLHRTPSSRESPVGSPGSQLTPSIGV